MKMLFLTLVLASAAMAGLVIDPRDFTGGVGQGVAEDGGGAGGVLTAYPVQPGGLNGAPPSNDGVFGAQLRPGPYGPVRAIPHPGGARR